MGLMERSFLDCIDSRSHSIEIGFLAVVSQSETNFVRISPETFSLQQCPIYEIWTDLLTDLFVDKDLYFSIAFFNPSTSQ